MLNKLSHERMFILDRNRNLIVHEHDCSNETVLDDLFDLMLYIQDKQLRSCWDGQ